MRNALGELAPRRQAVSRLSGELERLKEQRSQLAADEQRLRDNLGALARDTALHKRTLDKLGETEPAAGKNNCRATSRRRRCDTCLGE